MTTREQRDEGIVQAMHSLEFAVRHLREVSALSDGCEGIVATDCYNDCKRLRSDLANFQAACDNYQVKRKINGTTTKS